MSQQSLADGTIGDGPSLTMRTIASYEARVASPAEFRLPHNANAPRIARALGILDDDARLHEMMHALERSGAMRDDAKRGDTDTTASRSFITAGSERELAGFRFAWDQAKAGHPQMVMIQGGAGSGKSALVQEAATQILAADPDTILAWGGANQRAQSAEQYLGFREAIDRIIRPPDSPLGSVDVGATRRALPGELAAAIIDRASDVVDVLASRRALRELADAHGLGSKLEQMLERNTSMPVRARWEAAANLIHDVASTQPLILILKNMQWAGALSVGLLQSIWWRLSPLPDLRLMVVVTWRDSDIGSPQARQRNAFHDVKDEFLHQPQVTYLDCDHGSIPAERRAFVRGAVAALRLPSDDDEATLVEWLWRRADGIPLPTFTLIRELRSQGILTSGADGAPAHLNVNKLPGDHPHPFRTIVRQRMRPLTQQAILALRVAAAQGNVALEALIRDVGGFTRERAQRVLNEELSAVHGLLAPGPPIVISGRAMAAWQFTDQAIGDEVYQIIPAPVRIGLHQRLAQAIQQRFDEHDLTTLTSLATQQELAGMFNDAAHTSFDAADVCLARMDWDLAAVYLDRSEFLAERANNQLLIWLGRAARLNMFRYLGEYDDALALAPRIIEQASLNDWSQVRAKTELHLGEIHYYLGNIEDAINHLQVAAALFLTIDNDNYSAAAHAMMAHAYYRIGKYDIAVHHGHEALRLARSVRNSWVPTEAWLAIANCRLDMGFFEEAIRSYRTAQEFGVAVGKLSNQALPAMNIALAHVILGNTGEAIAQINVVLDDMRAMPMAPLTAHAHLFAGHAYALAERYATALEHYRTSYDQRMERPGNPFIADSLAGLLLVALRTHATGDIRMWTDLLDARISELGWAGMEDVAQVAVVLAEGLREIGREADARIRLRAAHAILMERSEAIADDQSRQQFLRAIPWNRKLQDRYAEL